MMLNTAQFEGSGGWALKPQGYLPQEHTQPKPRRAIANISVRLYAGQALGPDRDVPNAYVKCELHVESRAEMEENDIPKSGKSKGGEYKRRSSVRHSRDPDFGGEAIDFTDVSQVVPELSFLRYVQPLRVLLSLLLARRKESASHKPFARACGAAAAKRLVAQHRNVLEHLIYCRNSRLRTKNVENATWPCTLSMRSHDTGSKLPIARNMVLSCTC